MWKFILSGITINVILERLLMKKKIIIFSLTMLIFILPSCTAENTDINANKTEPLDTIETPLSTSTTMPPTSSITDSTAPIDYKEKEIKPYDDIRYFERSGHSATYEESDYNMEDIYTFTFNEGTVLKGNEELQEQIMENGKNPGLKIKTLHEEGITGKGVNVAIIDQNLLLHHPEFDGKIVKYYDSGCNVPANSGSMHAPAVTSILVGSTIGVAPDARVYFAAAPSWTNDSHYEADSLYWIIEQNKELPAGEKIRVVSVSAAPSGHGSSNKNQNEWDEAVLAAQDAGILVLDCRVGEKTGIIGTAYFDPTNPDDISLCLAGFPSWSEKGSLDVICVPTSYRTVAEEYTEGCPSYQYTGQGGLSWGIPYAAGVLALGWQVNPKLDNDSIVNILSETCYINKEGNKIINPTAFIEAVEKTK